MLKKLFIQLLEKLKTENKNDSTSVSGSFKFFVIDVLEATYAKPNYINPRTLVNYYNKYVEGSNNGSGEPKSELKDLISDYLGCIDYADFENLNRETESSQIQKNVVLEKSSDEIIIQKEIFFIDNLEEKSSIRKYRKLLISSSLIVVFLGSFFIYKFKNSNTDNCIIWVGNHFEKSVCSKDNAIDNLIYNVDIDNFDKAEVSKSTSFFKDKNPLFWYGKSPIGKIEFFTNRGIHPETLNELKPVTKYIINKYVLESNVDKTILN